MTLKNSNHNTSSLDNFLRLLITSTDAENEDSSGEKLEWQCFKDQLRKQANPVQNTSEQHLKINFDTLKKWMVHA